MSALLTYHLAGQHCQLHLWFKPWHNGAHLPPSCNHHSLSAVTAPRLGPRSLHILHKSAPLNLSKQEGAGQYCRGVPWAYSRGGLTLQVSFACTCMSTLNC